MGTDTIVLLVLQSTGMSNSHYKHNSNGMELGEMANINSHNPYRQYVDPRNYSSMSHAFEQNSIKEIPPKEIVNMEEIGVGKEREKERERERERCTFHIMPK